MHLKYKNKLKSQKNNTIMLHTTMAQKLTVVILLAIVIQGTHALEFIIKETAPSTPGGARFQREVGVEYTKQTLDKATNFIWGIFQQSPAERKHLDKVTMFVEDFDGIAFAGGDEIHFSVRFINDFKGDIKKEMTAILYHETTHVWQWNGEGKSPVGLIEGIADYVRLRTGLLPPDWTKPGDGDRWDQGYGITARFLEYCNSLKNGFVAQLNKKMRKDYSNNYFVELLGKPVDQLWKDYKAKYGK